MGESVNPCCTIYSLYCGNSQLPWVYIGQDVIGIPGLESAALPGEGFQAEKQS